MLVILDRQHGQKAPGRPFDPGATFGTLRETDLAAAYVDAAAAILREHGHDVELLSHGPYEDRHDAAVALARRHGGRVAYVAAHVNAGGGTYALVEYDARSIRGAQLADVVAGELRCLPGILASRTRGLSAGERGFVCIDGIYAGPAGLSAVLFEPGFIDAPAHASLWTPDGLARVGRALAMGLDAWGAA